MEENTRSRRTGFSLPIDEKIHVEVGLLGSKVWKADLADMIEIHPDALHEDLEDHGGFVAWWFSLSEVGVVEVAEMEEDFKDIEAIVDAEIRESLVVGEVEGKPKTKAPTETSIAGRVRLDTRVQQARDRLFRARKVLALLKAGAKAFDHRLKTLLARVGKDSQEWASSDPRPREERGVHRLLENGGRLSPEEKQAQTQDLLRRK